MMQASTTATTLTHRAAAAAPLRAPSCRRRAVAAVLHARAVAAPERLTTTGRPARQHAHQRQRQQVQWQQALLGEMQQAYVADAEGNNSNAHNPSATSSSCAAGAGRLESLLDEVYEAIDEVFYSKGGFKIPPAERKLIDATGGSSSYGEIEASGIDQLLRCVRRGWGGRGLWTCVAAGTQPQQKPAARPGMHACRTFVSAQPQHPQQRVPPAHAHTPACTCAHRVAGTLPWTATVCLWTWAVAEAADRKSVV